MVIVGLGGLSNNPACAVLRDGAIVAAAEQHKIARRFELQEIPSEALDACLELAKALPSEVAAVAIARPFSDRRDSRMQLLLRERFPNARIATVEHHRAHAASAYFASPFEEATVLTLDRSGDFRCGARWHAHASAIDLDTEISYPDSIGDLYTRVTELLGFRPRSEEHKVQWLSAFAPDDLASVFRRMMLRETTGFRLDRTFFDSDRLGKGGFSDRFYEEIGLDEDSSIDDGWRARIASGLQSAVEQLTLEMAGEGENLCLAGGLFYNAMLVSAFERSGRWKNVFVQPAAGNSGTSMGAAWWAWHGVFGRTERAPLRTLALGPGFGVAGVKEVLENCKLRFELLLTNDAIIRAAVEQMAGDKILAWMQGRMEFGPRALGNRSILASPLNPYSSENLNIYIKRRERFRKFAASVPAEAASRYFEAGANARFLATVSKVRPEHRKTFEAALLGPDTLRVHVVEKEENPLFHALLTEWGVKTGLPVLYNTSFNLFGDPLVCTPRDAVRSFYSSGIDAMIAGSFLLEK
jgi:carbamoyltransferase